MLQFRRPAVAGTLLIAASLLAAPATAQEKVLVDYRDPAFRVGQALYPPPLQERIATGIKASPDASRALGDKFVILGDARGTFMKSSIKSGAQNGEQTVYLLANRPPVAIEPFPEGPGPVLAVFQGGAVAGTFQLPQELRYQRLVGTVDADRDGVSEVLLEGSSYNMGQSVTKVDLVKLGPGATASVLQSLKEVDYDGCENPVGKKERWASTIALGPDGKLVAKRHPMKCG